MLYEKQKKLLLSSLQNEENNKFLLKLFILRFFLK